MYDALEQQYPFLSVSAVSPKPMLFSLVLSALNFTGFFFPFTGEANLNVDSPECLHSGFRSRLQLGHLIQNQNGAVHVTGGIQIS